MEHCFQSTQHINLVVAGKQPMPQWLTLEEAREEFRGASIWHWASTNGGEDPQVELAASGTTSRWRRSPRRRSWRGRRPTGACGS